MKLHEGACFLPYQKRTFHGRVEVAHPITMPQRRAT